MFLIENYLLQNDEGEGLLDSSNLQDCLWGKFWVSSTSHYMYFCNTNNHLRGMLSANEWGNIWPETRGNIFVTCSVYLASLKVNLRPHIMTAFFHI